MGLRTLVALLWLVGVLTMHGVSVHHGDAAAERPSAAAALDTNAFAPLAAAETGDPLDDDHESHESHDGHDGHGDHGHAPCPQCAHHDSPCTSAVTVSATGAPEPRVDEIRHHAWQARALVRLWSPDPPVPRLDSAPRPS